MFLQMESVINMGENEKIIKTEIIPFPLNDSGKVSINNLDFWPVVDILLNKEKIYIGQTNDLTKRQQEVSGFYKWEMNCFFFCKKN